MTTQTAQYENVYARNYGVFTKQEQEHLKNARVAIIGAGGVGGITLISLARMGLGHLTICDGDHFEESNINRQMLAFLSNKGISKAQVAANTVKDINPLMSVTHHQVRVSEENAQELLKNHDVIIDATDNLVSRVIIHRAAAAIGIPSIWIAVTPPFRGGVMCFNKEAMPYELALQHPSYQQALTPEMRTKIEALKDGRARTAVKHGALADWAQGFINKQSPWAVICPVANMIGLLASFEAMKFIIKRENLAPTLAPQLVKVDLSSPDMVKVHTPSHGSWNNEEL